MKSFWAVVLVGSGLAPAQAYTCADVRALTAEQQAYYVKVFNITPAQQNRIRRACYGTGQHRLTEVTEEKPLHPGAHNPAETKGAP